MKKIFTAIALAAAVTASSAAGLTAFTSYDYQRATNGSTLGYEAIHEGHVGVALNTALGTVDVAAVADQFVSSRRDNAGGIEVGYSKGLSLGPVAVTGRVDYGRVYEDRSTFSQYYGASVEASTKLGPVSPFVAYRFRHELNDTDLAATNRYLVGVSAPLTSKISARAGYSYAKQDGRTFNGLTTAVNYTF